jgi:uncharacterized membrane protein
MVTASRNRITAIDACRGLAIILMALDHVRDFIGPSTFDYMAIHQTTWAMFVTRLVTNFCAPAFIFLAGVSIYIQKTHYSSTAHTRLLLTRGLWIILLEVSYLSFCWRFNFSVILLQVMWAIGISMILMSVLKRFQPRYILLLGVIIAATHNLLDPLDANLNQLLPVAWDLIHQKATLLNSHGFRIIVSYPILPWLSIMMIGYGLGRWFTDLTKQQRDKKLLVSSMILMLIFIIVRLLNVYGDPIPFHFESSPLLSLMAVLHVTKYPPSCIYILFNLSLLMFVLFVMDFFQPSRKNPLMVFGAVPMFFYLLHIPLIHMMAIILSLVIYHQPLDWASMGHLITRKAPPGYEISLIKIYAAWLFTLVITYPVCTWFRGVKNRYDTWILKYFCL